MSKDARVLIVPVRLRQEGDFFGTYLTGSLQVSVQWSPRTTQVIRVDLIFDPALQDAVAADAEGLTILPLTHTMNFDVPDPTHVRLWQVYGDKLDWPEADRAMMVGTLQVWRRQVGWLSQGQEVALSVAFRPDDELQEYLAHMRHIQLQP